MTCDRFTDRLMDYLEHDTDDATRVAMERHAVTCGECGPLLADLRKLRVDAANLPEVAPARDLWSGIEARIETPVVSIGGTGPRVLGGRALGRWGRGALIAASLLAAAGVGYVARGAPQGTAGTELVVIPADDGPDAPGMVADTAGAVAGPVAPVAPVVPGARVASRGTPAPATTAPAGAAPTGGPRALEVQLAVATLTADYDREIARLRALIEQRRNQLDPTTVAVIERNLAVIDTAILESKRAVASDPSSRFLIEFLNQSLQKKVELMRTVAMLPNRT